MKSLIALRQKNDIYVFIIEDNSRKNLYLNLIDVGDLLTQRGLIEILFF